MWQIKSVGIGLFALLIAAGSPRAWTQEASHTLAPVTVIGSKENMRSIAGSGAYLGLTDIRQPNYDDINRVLRRVPGVYIREEDGFGLFPNLSLRGVAPGRTAKVTVMEDGVLMAPAPYSAPAAYYSPTTGRMSGLEVLKGSSQIKYGPQTSGGVINYLSTPIPQESEGYLKTLYGTDKEIRNHIYYGGTMDTPAGRVGYLLEYYDRQTDGFKTIDAASDFTDRSDTGFRKNEPILKLSWEPNSDLYQRFEFKAGYTELVADETYMGLTEADFAADPFRRYSGSRFARISTRQSRFHLRHQIELSPEIRVTSTAYYNEFKRNWFKERTTGADLADPARVAVLKGEAAGNLNYRNNNREYESYGLETVLNFTAEWGDTEHAFDVGLRYHRDEIRRFQRDDTFVQDAQGAIVDRIQGVPGGGGNRLQEAEALALHLQDAITHKQLTLVPGVRYEHVDFSFTEFDTTGNPSLVTGRGDSTLDVVAPGLGIIYDLSEAASVFGGVHRGFSLPGPRANARSGIEEETSIGYELGVRYDDRRAFNGELALFLTDFDDLLVPDIIGAGGTLEGTENVGNIISYGLELQLAYDLGVAQDWGFSNPWYLTATLTQAELDGDSTSLDEESIFAGGQDGNDVPYIPDYQFLVGTGIEAERWGAFVDVVIVDETFTSASNSDSLADPLGRPNAAFGKTDDYIIVDASAYYRIKDGVKLVASVHNVFDEEYVSARHPAGPRPGKPFTALGGVEVRF